MIDLTPAKIKESLTSDQYKLYKLVWERFIASQMAACVQDTVSADITAGEHLFKASGFSVRFDGFTAPVYRGGGQRGGAGDAICRRLEEGEHLTLKELKPNQHFTQPPPRYTEATLIKALEENGIGRPSTYAPTISTILQPRLCGAGGQGPKAHLAWARGDHRADEGALQQDIVDVKFTAKMEKELDEVEAGKTDWVGYDAPTSTTTLTRRCERPRRIWKAPRCKIPDEETDMVCELCGRKMVIKTRPIRQVLGLPGLSPSAKIPRPIVSRRPAGICPRCGKKVLAKKSKTGRTYYGCEDNPKCAFMTWDEPAGGKVPAVRQHPV